MIAARATHVRTRPPETVEEKEIGQAKTANNSRSKIGRRKQKNSIKLHHKPPAATKLLRVTVFLLSVLSKRWTPNQVGLLHFLLTGHRIRCVVVFRAGHRIRWVYSSCLLASQYLWLSVAVFLLPRLDTESGGSSRLSLGLDTESGGSSPSEHRIRESDGSSPFPPVGFTSGGSSPFPPVGYRSDGSSPFPHVTDQMGLLHFLM
ncbi:unnamed protein product [Rodentolepis nana]|uniref:Transmembrane protein n=1 Tax=Rodentolepis nana TaxID=102285 RepID=A0A0R3TNX1_RODNA|nr:unnamed protein product [Rodentolepis nana]